MGSKEVHNVRHLVIGLPLAYLTAKLLSCKVTDLDMLFQTGTIEV